MKTNKNPKATLTDGEIIICRCEEITKQQIVDAVYDGYNTVNSIRKKTRAGMGFCQGKTCGNLIQQIICQYANMNPEKVIPARVRPPTRPINAETIAKGGDLI